jgi:hypothetical protein
LLRFYTLKAINTPTLITHKKQLLSDLQLFFNCCGVKNTDTLRDVLVIYFTHAALTTCTCQCPGTRDI